MDKKQLHIIPLKLRVGVNEDHAALDALIRDYSSRMGMSMSTFITTVLLDVLLQERKVGIFRDAAPDTLQAVFPSSAPNTEKSGPKEKEQKEQIEQVAKNTEETDIYSSPTFLNSLIELDEEA